MKKVLLSLICLIPIPLALNFYSEAVAVQMGIGVISFIAGLLILILQKNIKEFKLLSLVQFIGKMSGDVLTGYLYLKNVSGDGESAAIFEVITIGAAIVFLVQFVIGYIISKQLKKNKVSNQ